MLGKTLAFNIDTSWGKLARQIRVEGSLSKGPTYAEHIGSDVKFTTAYQQGPLDVALCNPLS